MLIYNVQQAGNYIVYGLSTDTKPVSPPDDSLFIETNTGNIYFSVSGVWTLPTGEKNIRALSDFPTPVSGVITLQDNTSYRITGTVDIGTNTIKLGVRNTIYGVDKFNDVLTGTTTGVLITMDGTASSKVASFFNTMTLKSPNGTLFSMTSPATAQVMVVDNCNLTASASMGTFNNVTSFSMRNSAVLNLTTNGFVFTGTNTNILVRDNQFKLNTGTVFNFGTSVNSIIEINRNIVNEAVSQIFISGTTGGANVTNSGNVTHNVFSGAGTFLSGITITDTGWNFTNNIGTTNSPILLTWGDITGTLSNQTDLQSVLDSINNDAIAYSVSL